MNATIQLNNYSEESRVLLDGSPFKVYDDPTGVDRVIIDWNEIATETPQGWSDSGPEKSVRDYLRARVKVVGGGVLATSGMLSTADTFLGLTALSVGAGGAYVGNRIRTNPTSDREKKHIVDMLIREKAMYDSAFGSLHSSSATKRKLNYTREYLEEVSRGRVLESLPYRKLTIRDSEIVVPESDDDNFNTLSEIGRKLGSLGVHPWIKLTDKDEQVREFKYVESVASATDSFRVGLRSDREKFKADLIAQDEKLLSFSLVNFIKNIAMRDDAQSQFANSIDNILAVNTDLPSDSIPTVTVLNANMPNFIKELSIIADNITENSGQI
jgi:hypothetical protein